MDKYRVITDFAIDRGSVFIMFTANQRWEYMGTNSKGNNLYRDCVTVTLTDNGRKEDSSK